MTDKSPESLASLLGIPIIWEQDWELVFADSERVADFCEIYERGPFSANDKRAIMQLIVASYDQHLRGPNPLKSLEPRIYELLKQDFELHRHTIEYWSALKSDYPETFWKVSPLMRKLLSEQQG